MSVSPNSLINVLLALGIMNSKINTISYGFKICTINKNERGEMDKMADIINSDNLCSKHLCISCQGIVEMLVFVFWKWSQTLHNSCVYLNEEEGC